MDVQISKMKAEHATLATKHRLTVTALQKKLKIARAALREHHTRPAVPSAAAFLPMPPATMPAATAKPTPTVTIIDTEATPASKESVPVLEVEVASTSSGNLSEAEQMAGDDKNSVQLEARAQTLERELSDAEDNLRDYIEELDEAGTDATMQGMLLWGECIRTPFLDTSMLLHMSCMDMAVGRGTWKLLSSVKTKH